jgi:hypothetical protein
VTLLAHPAWCARSYRCTATCSGGEHLSAPVTLPAGGGRAGTVISLAQPVRDRAPIVEIRLRVRLCSRTQDGQIRLIHRLLLGLNRAVREVTQ